MEFLTTRESCFLSPHPSLLYIAPLWEVCEPQKSACLAQEAGFSRLICRRQSLITHVSVMVLWENVGRGHWGSGDEKGTKVVCPQNWPGLPPLGLTVAPVPQQEW